jgi:hypothetical protein
VVTTLMRLSMPERKKRRKSLESALRIQQNWQRPITVQDELREAGFSASEIDEYLPLSRKGADELTAQHIIGTVLVW